MAAKQTLDAVIKHVDGRRNAWERFAFEFGEDAVVAIYTMLAELDDIIQVIKDSQNDETTK